MSLNGKQMMRVISCTIGMWMLVATSVATAQVLPVSKGRQLAPDALVVIDPAAEWGETYQGPVDLPLVVKHADLAWTPEYSPATETLIQKAKSVIFRGDVYCLEFAFKPVRMLEVPLPTADGVKTKTVWYMLYRVRYLGGDLRPVPEPDAFDNEVYATPQSVSAEWVRFMPTFRLQALGLNKEYLDRILPSVTKLIAKKERVGKPLFDSVEIQSQKIKLSTDAEDNAVWGVAVWTDVDPRTDFFAVQVQGLTNAQQLKLVGDKLEYPQKTLVLHFSRPGDTMSEIEDRIRYGIPALSDPDRQEYILKKYGQTERLDHVWVYR